MSVTVQVAPKIGIYGIYIHKKYSSSGKEGREEAGRGEGSIFTPLPQCHASFIFSDSSIAAKDFSIARRTFSDSKISLNLINKFLTSPGKIPQSRTLGLGNSGKLCSSVSPCCGERNEMNSHFNSAGLILLFFSYKLYPEG